MQENLKIVKYQFGSPQNGEQWGTETAKGAENGFKNCRKKFCKDCENFKSIGQKSGPKVKNSYFGNF